MTKQTKREVDVDISVFIEGWPGLIYLPVIKQVELDNTVAWSTIARPIRTKWDNEDNRIGRRRAKKLARLRDKRAIRRLNVQTNKDRRVAEQNYKKRIAKAKSTFKPKPLPYQLPDQWPPTNWVATVAPKDDSLQNIRQWFDWVLHGNEAIRLQEMVNKYWPMKDDFTDLVKDALRLIVHLHRTGLIDLPEVPQRKEYTALEAHVQIAEWRKAIVVKRGKRARGSKGRGRPRRTAELKAWQAAITAEWKRFLESKCWQGQDGTPKSLFCKSEGIELEDLETALRQQRGDRANPGPKTRPKQRGEK